jgi:hypothetical protein
MKELKINPPEGYEVDEDRSDLKEGVIYFKEKDNGTYGEIMRELCTKYRLRYLQSDEVYSIGLNANLLLIQRGHIGISTEQLKSLLALNKLINVAVYLNDGWMPDSDRESGVYKFGRYKYFISISYQYNNSGKYSLIIGKHETVVYSCVYFKSKELARKAIKILGEEVIVQALTLNHKPLER